MRPRDPWLSSAAVRTVLYALRSIGARACLARAAARSAGAAPSGMGFGGARAVAAPASLCGGASLSVSAPPWPPGQAAAPAKRGSGSTEDGSMPQISAARRVSVVSSIALKKAMSRLPSSCGVAKASSGVSTGTSRSKVTSCFEIMMRLTISGSVSASRRFGCLISPARARSVSRSPYSRMSCAAVLTPMPGAPGTLSVKSPASAWASMTLSGPTPRNI